MAEPRASVVWSEEYFGPSAGNAANGSTSPLRNLPQLTRAGKPLMACPTIRHHLFRIFAVGSSLNLQKHSDVKKYCGSGTTPLRRLCSAFSPSSTFAPASRFASGQRALRAVGDRGE